MKIVDHSGSLKLSPCLRGPWDLIELYHDRTTDQLAPVASKIHSTINNLFTLSSPAKNDLDNFASNLSLLTVILSASKFSNLPVFIIVD